MESILISNYDDDEKPHILIELKNTITKLTDSTWEKKRSSKDKILVIMKSRLSRPIDLILFSYNFPPFTDFPLT
jgi:hypothetical protein